MRGFCIWLLGLSILSLASGMYEDTSSIIKITNSIDFVNVYFEVDYLTAVLFYRNNPRSSFLEPIFTEFAESKSKYYKCVAVDCDAIDFDANRAVMAACREEFRDALPQILFLEPPENKIDPITNKAADPAQHRFSGESSVEALNSFAKKFMPSFSRRLVTENDLEDWFKDRPIATKAIFFTNSKSIPQYYKALTSYFKDRIAFAEALGEAAEVVDRYNIAKFPQLLVLTENENGGFNKDFYSGTMDLNSIIAYLEPLAQAKTPKKPIGLEIQKPADRKKVSSDSEEAAQSEETNTQEQPEANANDFMSKIKTLDVEKFESVVYGKEGLVMIHLYRGDELHSAFEEVHKKFNSLIDIYNVQCDSPGATKFCEETLNVKNYPAIKLFPIGDKARKRKSKILYTKILNAIEIAREISDLIDDPTKSLNPASFSAYLQDVVTHTKPSLVLFHNQDEISMSLRVLAQLNRYKKRINFANYQNPPSSIKDQFKFDKLPKVVMVFLKDPTNTKLSPEENVGIAQYAGKFTYNDLRHFLDTFLPHEERTLTLSKKIPQVDTQEDFNLVCNNKGDNCVIALLDGFHGNDYAELRVKNELSVIEKVKKQFGKEPLTFVWLDAACHSETLESMDIKPDLPTVLFYTPSSKTFSELIGEYNTTNIQSFVEAAASGNLPFSGTRTIPKFQTRNCAIFHQLRGAEAIQKASPIPANQPSQDSGESTQNKKTKKKSKQTSKKTGGDEL